MLTMIPCWGSAFTGEGAQVAQNFCHCRESSRTIKDNLSEYQCPEEQYHTKHFILGRKTLKIVTSLLTFGLIFLNCVDLKKIPLIFSLVSYKYLFIWLHWVLVTAHGVFFASSGIFRCGAQYMWLPLDMWDLCSLTQDWTRIPCIARWIVNHWTTKEAPFLSF